MVGSLGLSGILQDLQLFIKARNGGGFHRENDKNLMCILKQSKSYLVVRLSMDTGLWRRVQGCDS